MMTFAEILAEKGKEAGFEFTERQLWQFTRYYELLVETNKVMNLTAITEPEEVAVKHFIDSLLAYDKGFENKSLADVGTGAGFPGVPLKIYCPSLKVTLIDSLGKRLKFLEQVIAELGYDPEADIYNSPDSVFCEGGAGFAVKWYDVPKYMHLESVLTERTATAPVVRQRRSLDIDERELEAIMEREFGPIKRPEYKTRFRNEAPERPVTISNKRDYIIVDGYNLIFAWDELKTLARERLDLARGRLMDMLSNYAGFTKAKLVLVFDGYRNPGSTGSKTDYHNIHVAYTKDGETADAYIERLLDEIGKNYSVRVITSDNLIRVSAMRSGVLRTSSGEFSKELEWTLEQIEQVLNKTNLSAHKTLLKDGKQ